MNRKSLVVVLAIVLVGALGYWFWNKNQKEEDVVKIGAILPLTGNLGFLGESAKTGLDFANFYFKKINTERKIEFIFEDGQGNPTNSINALNKLINIEKVNIIFSTISAVELSLIPTQEKEPFLFISHSSHPKLSGVNNLVFRHSPSVDQEVELIKSRLTDIDNVVVTYMTDDYGVSFESSIKKLTVVKSIASIGFQKGEANFNAIAQKIVEKKPTKIILCAGGNNLSNLVQKIRELNCNAEIITTLAFSVSGAAQNVNSITNLTMINFKPLIPQKTFKRYIEEYEKISGKKLKTAELLFFNSALLIYNCSKETTDINMISKRIKSKSEWQLLGELAKVSTKNDILPNLEFIEK